MRFLLPIFLLSCLSFPGFAQTTTQDSKPAPQLDHFDPKKVDSSVDPCTDFYQYSCNRWIADNPVPPDEVFWDSFGKLQLWNETFLHQTVLEVAAKPASQRTPVEQKVGDYWSACRDQKQRNANALPTLRPQLERIEAMSSKSQIVEVVADLHRSMSGAWNPADPETYAPLFGFGAQPDFHDTGHVLGQFDQGGMSMPGRDFYLNDDAKSVEIRTKYVVHIARMLELSGVPATEAKTDADVILKMETSMAKAAMEIVKRRDPKNLDHEMSLDAVQKLTPSFNFSRYLHLMRASTAGTFIVTSPDFFRSTEQLIQAEPLDHWKAYFRWQLLNGLAGALSEDFVNEDFTFFPQTLFGAKELQPLWRRCIQSEDRDIGQLLGQAYVARAFPPESKERVQEMVNALKAALGQEIDTMDWMSPETKKQARIKLTAQIDKIGYPDHWRDYSALQITADNHLANVEGSAAFEMDRQLKKIGKPLDRTEWGMTPPTVNAYEDAQTNTINFPAGILQPVYFDLTEDDVINYGAEGAVVGHEITHVFDDQGRKFDLNGNLHDWWTPADAQ